MSTFSCHHQETLFIDNTSVEITFLPDRDALKRTRTAHVELSSRNAAIGASYITGQVYGLKFDVVLAVELEDGADGAMLIAG